MKEPLMIDKIVISQKDFLQYEFTHPDERIIDYFTKRALHTAEFLFRADFSQLDSEKTGLVLSTRRGVYRSLGEIAEAIREKGYKGINPSFFPNVMLSTTLARLAILCNVHGPSCVFYDEEENDKDAMEYCELQIQLGNCEAMILICADETDCCKGYFMRGNYENCFD